MWQETLKTACVGGKRENLFLMEEEITLFPTHLFFCVADCVDRSTFISFE